MSGAPRHVGHASWWRRIASISYESILIIAVVFIATALFPGAASGRLSTGMRYLLFAYLVVVVGLYLAWSWKHGQTLAMKAWRISIVDRDGMPLTWRRAIGRYLAALAFLGPLLAALLWLREHRDAWLAWSLTVPGALALLWPLWDARRRALYDLLAGTQLVWIPRLTALDPPHHDDGGPEK